MTSSEPRSNVIQFADPDAHDDFGCCGLLRGIHDEARMLELRLRTGVIVACGYMWLDNAVYDPSEGITLCFARQRVRIVGQHLDSPIRSGVRLFDALVRHRVVWLRECAGDVVNGLDGGVFVERIDVE